MKKALFFTLAFAISTLVLLVACERKVDDFTPNNYGTILRLEEPSTVMMRIIHNGDTLYNFPSAQDSLALSVPQWKADEEIQIRTGQYLNKKHSILLFHNKKIIDTLNSDTLILYWGMEPDTIQTIDTTYTFK